MQKQLNIILNGKGGVGKSFFAVNLAQYLKDRRIGHFAIDTDNENSTLSRFYPDAGFVDIGADREIDSIFLALRLNNLVLIDCRAASTDIFLNYFAEIRVFEMLQILDAALTIIMPVNHEADSVEQIKIITESFDAQCGYLVVKNQVHSEHFDIYERSKTRSRVIAELAGREIVMPRLHDWLVSSLNEKNRLITDALKDEEFWLVDRQRLKNWQGTFNEQLDSASDWLVPDGDPRVAALKSKKTRSHDELQS